MGGMECPERFPASIFVLLRGAGHTVSQTALFRVSRPTPSKVRVGRLTRNKAVCQSVWPVRIQMHMEGPAQPARRSGPRAVRGPFEPARHSSLYAVRVRTPCTRRAKTCGFAWPGMRKKPLCLPFLVCTVCSACLACPACFACLTLHGYLACLACPARSACPACFACPAIPACLACGAFPALPACPA